MLRRKTRPRKSESKPRTRKDLQNLGTQNDTHPRPKPRVREVLNES